MANKLKPGDDVAWQTPQGKTTGSVTKKLTSDTHIQGHAVKASPDDPRFEVKSDKTGKVAAHKPDALRKAGR